MDVETSTWMTGIVFARTFVDLGDISGTEISGRGLEGVVIEHIPASRGHDVTRAPAVAGALPFLGNLRCRC